MPRGNSSLVSRSRFASVRSSRCSTSFQSMKRQPAVRCCGLSAFCVAVCTNESSNWRSTAVLESRLTCSKLDSTFQEELCEVFGHLLTDRALESAHVHPVHRLSVSREVPLDVAQFDVRPGVAHDAAKFRSNVLWRTIQNQEPGCELGVTRACVHVRVDRVDHVQECLLRDPVRRGVGHELARKVWSMRVYSPALHLIDNLRPHSAPHVHSERDRDEGARGVDTSWLCFFWSTHARLLERCAQLSRPGSRCDPVRFRSDRTGR